jgi:very-short-patch-repair endonuclease
VVPIELTHGPFTLAEAHSAGLTRKQLRGATWRRLGGGLYAWGGLADGPMLALRAMRRRLPDGAAFSGRTAGWLHGLDLAPCDPIEVTVPAASGVSGKAGVLVHRSGLAGRDIVQRRGLPSTSALRTAVDLGSTLPLPEAVVAIDMALHQRLVSLDTLRRYVDANAGRKGVGQQRRVVDLADPAAESAMETRLRLLIVLAGLPRPETQVPLRDDRGCFIGRPDLYYRAARLCLEYDGAGHRDRLVEDTRRQNRLLNAGFRLLRFTASDVLQTPDAVVAQVRAALRA